ncbi:DUF294 nucleotidyltransferase-like domain-containing protein [Neobacillus sp. LXY-4]|uniref:DUF294 nucleotidyltransferase-like domain-containing protein n=1 Tax=Neobacillus sp. LXY-4 TaxID=3379826 RepID=UPI003EE2542D
MANEVFHSYESIRRWKDEQISHYHSDNTTLNHFHDKVMQKVYALALTRLNKGAPPCSFSWFITGSGGRFEQGLISDQDHGIVYELSNNQSDEYFIALGKELSFGLNIVGYPYCEGNVMSSNPLWCKSLEQWRLQILQWMEEGSFQTIRNLQIFFDARILIGNSSLIQSLKTFIFEYQQTNPNLIKRLMENVMHIKNAVGPLGQIIVEEKGLHAGEIDLKYSAFLPYVNAIRLLAIKEGISETSTLNRLDELINQRGYNEDFVVYKANFLQLLKFRLSLFDTKDSYDDIHFLDLKQLSREEKKEIKRILKDGKKLHQNVNRIIEKGC